VLAGALLGILIPLSWPMKLSTGAIQAGAAERNTESGLDPGRLAAIVAAILILMVAFGLTVGLGVAENQVPLEIVGAASGGALLGLFVPSPATRR
jgi:hypothetical protein